MLRGTSAKKLEGLKGPQATLRDPNNLTVQGTRETLWTQPETLGNREGQRRTFQGAPALASLAREVGLDGPGNSVGGG